METLSTGEKMEEIRPTVFYEIRTLVDFLVREQLKFSGLFLMAIQHQFTNYICKVEAGGYMCHAYKRFEGDYSAY